MVVRDGSTENFNFSFPGEAYSVQKELMTAIYDTIEGRQIGLFESPTGTGKTLSIICGSLTWLQQNRRFASSSEGLADDTEEPGWVFEQTRAREQRAADDEFQRRKNAYANRVSSASKRPSGKKLRRRGRGPTGHGVRHDGHAIPSSDDEDADGTNVLREKKAVKSTRIIFATRTHSQLTQFLEELRKTKFSPPVVLDKPEAARFRHGIADRLGSLKVELPLSIVPFGSRKQFCINEQVRALETSAAISERCRELTEASTDTSAASKRKRSQNSCLFKNPEAEAILRDRALVQIHSIEELAESGRCIGACPYFATRSALESGDVDVIGVPYSAVLHAPTRKSLGLEIDENTVVIFDEAHNIVNTVCDLHSSVLSRPALVQARTALTAYIARYESRFSSGNLFSLRQLVALCEGLLSLLPDLEDVKNRHKLPKPRVTLPTAMLFDAGVDNINLFPLVNYLQESKLSKKLRGFVDSGAGGETTAYSEASSGKECNRELQVQEQRLAKQALSAFENFIASIADCPSYGRVALYPYSSHAFDPLKTSGPEGQIKRVPLDATARLKYFVTEPGELFKTNVGQARSILLLGGTLSPRDSIKRGLLSGLDSDVKELECEHVVPPDHILASVCGRGLGGNDLEFTFRNRRSTDITDELGKSIEAVLGVVPGGVVLFFSSYELLRVTTQRWKSTGLLSRMESTKPFFAEERGDDRAFESYREAIDQDSKRGALLAAVMGGKLSEGINFSDELGRAVIVVGMPFANAMQVETKEVLQRFGTAGERGEFLENKCMTVVNQCIGRAVRHRRDYAVVLLMDRRYGRQRVLGKLPKFIRRGLRQGGEFKSVVGSLRGFFEQKM